MQRDGIVIGIRVRDTMQAELVGHVRDLVLLICLLGYNMQWPIF